MTPLTLLFITVFNSILGLSVLFPVLAPLCRALGLSVIQGGSLSAAYALMQFAMSPYWGRRSEVVGRKPVMLTGIIGFGLSFLAFALLAQLGHAGHLEATPLYLALVVARLVGGALSSATLPTAQAYVADVTDRDGRTSGMAVIGAAFGLGVIFGPGIGALLSGIHLLAPVYASAALAGVNALFVYLRLPEPERGERGRVAAPLTARDGRIFPLLAVGFVVTLAAVGMEQTVAFYFQDRLELSAVDTARHVGLALVLYGIVAVFAQGLIVRKLRLRPATLVAVGLPLAIAGYALFIFARGFASLSIALALQGFGQGLIVPGMTAAASLAVGDDEQGAIAGLNSAAQGLGRALGPIVGTALYELRPEYPYLLGAALLAVVFVLTRASQQLRAAIAGAADRPVSPRA
ncbi:MAG: MFS transporter [Myxococcales bacterium]|nr:MFS transporter [Myxococcales bacterium]